MNINNNNRGVTATIRPDKTAARRVFDQKGDEFASELEKYIVPEEKLEAIVEYGIKLIANNPQMKIARIARKTAEYFKLEIRKDQENDSEA